MNSEMQSRRRRLSRAFNEDGFDIAACGTFEFNHRLGLIAEHRTARNYDTGRPKRAYYVEGEPYEMGYLMGRMAEPEIDRMTSQYIDGMVRAMIRGQFDDHRTGGEDEEPPSPAGLPLFEMHSPLVRIVYKQVKDRGVRDAVPGPLREEIRGIVDGCRYAAALRGQRTSVNQQELWVLNAGIDVLYAIAYTGRFLSLVFGGLDRSRLRSPLLCNGFTLLNDATKRGALFGRDFMFPTGGSFQDLACLIVRNPTPGTGQCAWPTVSLAAPGIVGSIAAMNTHGVAAGVDVSPGANSEPRSPGMNSLLLVRHSIEQGEDAAAAVNHILAAQRGVAWCYMVADGGHGEDRACVVEAGASNVKLPSVRYLQTLRSKKPALHRLLPDRRFLLKHPTGETVNGAMVRWADDVLALGPYHETFNGKLWRHFGKESDFAKASFGPRGYISETRRLSRCPSDHEARVHRSRCPENYYFAPQRGKPGEVLLLTNHFLHPAMRICAMNWWTNKLQSADSYADDTQWRYDELNNQILTTLDAGPISYRTARKLIDYLSPLGAPPVGCYYAARGPWSRDEKQIAVSGGVLLFDLKSRTVEAKYGYHIDEWVRIDLTKYVQ